MYCSLRMHPDFTIMAYANLQTRQDIFDSTTRIKQLTQQPSDFLTDILVQQQQYTCIEWIWNFKVLAEIPLPPGSISYADLATKLQIPPSTLRSVARMAMTANFLCETKDGSLAHNAISAVFVKDDSMATWLSYLLRRTIPFTRAFTQATEKWPNPTKDNETAYNLAMETDLQFFDHLKANPDLAAEFSKYMTSQSTGHRGASVDHLLKGLDWATLGNAKVVDVCALIDVLKSWLMLMHHRLAEIPEAPRLHWQRYFQIFDSLSKIFRSPFATPELKPGPFPQKFCGGLNSSSMTSSLHSQSRTPTSTFCE